MRKLVALALVGSALVAAAPARAVHTGLYAFRYLGGWVDLWDYALDPATALADMGSRGVRTVFLQTARWTSDADIVDPVKVGRWVDEAYARGLRIVGWYLPGYGNLTRDVRRTVAIASFRSPRGHRFHAVAIDIEDKKEVGGGEPFNDGIARHLSRVRYRLGSAYPVGAIVPAPVAMAIRPAAWEGFPWRAIGRWANVVLPMAYWSYRHDCPDVPDHCPYWYGRKNTEQARRLTGLRVHTIGGVAADVTEREVLAFNRGVYAAGAYGGSIYDYRTTPATFWNEMALFNRL